MSEALSPPVARSSRPLPVPAYAVAIALAMLVAAVLTTAAIGRIDSYQAGTDDLDIQGQVVWNTAQGRPFASTVLVENDTHLAEHLAFVLLPLALVFAVAPDDRLLVVTQALALGGSSVAIFLYARQQLRSPAAALILQLAFLAMPLTASVALDDFHPVAISVLPLAFGAYLTLSGRPVPGVALLALAVLVEEEAALPVLGLGLLLALRGQRRLGLTCALAAGAYLLIATQVVMPAFQNPQLGTNRTLAHFGDARSNVGVLAGRFSAVRIFDAVLWLLFPTGGTVLAAPGALLAALPTFTVLLSLDESLGARYRDHWSAVMLPMVWIASVDGVRRLSGMRVGSGAALALVTAGTLAMYALQSPIHPSRVGEQETDRPAERRDDVTRALAQVPPAVPLIASQSLVAYLNKRPEIFVFPPGRHYAPGAAPRAAKVDVYVLDFYDGATLGALTNRENNPLRRDPPPVLFSPGYKVLLVQSDYPAPAVPVQNAAFGNVFQLIGYDVSTSPDVVTLTLQWQALGTPMDGFGRIVDLVDAEGRVVSSERRMTLLNVVPTEEWRSGQRIVDRVELAFPSARRPKLPYTFRVSWVPRRGDEDSPLTLADGSRAFESGPIVGGESP